MTNTSICPKRLSRAGKRASRGEERGGRAGERDGRVGEGGGDTARELVRKHDVAFLSTQHSYPALQAGAEARRSERAAATEAEEHERGASSDPLVSTRGSRRWHEEQHRQALRRQRQHANRSMPKPIRCSPKFQSQPGFLRHRSRSVDEPQAQFSPTLRHRVTTGRGVRLTLPIRTTTSSHPS